jgi:hypothetical protein
VSLVLYPDDLRVLGSVFDDLCDQLSQSGARFSREILARRLLAEASKHRGPPFEIACVCRSLRRYVALENFGASFASAAHGRIVPLRGGSRLTSPCVLAEDQPRPTAADCSEGRL